MLFDNDDIAWDHYKTQYEAVRSVAVSRMELRDKVIPAERIPIEETPVFKEVEESRQDVRIYVPAESEQEAEVSLPRVLETVVKVAGALRRPLAEVRPDRNGYVSVTPKVVKESITISRSRPEEDDRPNVYLSYDGREFVLSGEVMRLETKPEEVRDDVARWIEFFGNYEKRVQGRRAAAAAGLLHLHELVLLFAAALRRAQRRSALRELQLRAAHVRRAVRVIQLRKDEPDRDPDALDVLVPPDSRDGQVHALQPAGPAGGFQAAAGRVRRRRARPLQTATRRRSSSRTTSRRRSTPASPCR